MGEAGGGSWWAAPAVMNASGRRCSALSCVLLVGTSAGFVRVCCCSTGSGL